MSIAPADFANMLASTTSTQLSMSNNPLPDGFARLECGDNTLRSEYPAYLGCPLDDQVGVRHAFNVAADSLSRLIVSPVPVGLVSDPSGQEHLHNEYDLARFQVECPCGISSLHPLE